MMCSNNGPPIHPRKCRVNERVWANPGPMYRISNYSVSTLQSMNRISIGIGLVLTHAMGLVFRSAKGFG